jgi:charged multivesicular body protein 5
MATDNLKNTFITVDAMRSANKELKKQYKSVNIDKIEKIQDVYCYRFIIGNGRIVGAS